MHSPLLIAVTLSATSLGIVLPILKDAGQVATTIGQVVVAGASIAEVAPIVLLSVLFSARGGGLVAPLALLVAFLALVAAVGAVIAGVERSGRLTRTLLALQETTAEIRVRGAFALLMLFASLATRFGLEAILGAFLAGATLRALDRDEAATHRLFHVKLQAVGFGVFVPFFFVSTGMSLDVRALVDTRPPSRACRCSWSRCWSCGPCRRCCYRALRAAPAGTGRRRAAAGDVAEHPGRGRVHRGRPRPAVRAELHRPRRRRAALGPDLPGAGGAAARSGAPRRPKGARFRRRAEAAS